MFEGDARSVQMIFPPNAPEALKGKIEMRGFGIVDVPFCDRHKLTHIYALHKDESLIDSQRQILSEKDWPEISIPITNRSALTWPACPIFSNNIAHSAKIIAFHAGFALPFEKNAIVRP